MKTRAFRLLAAALMLSVCVSPVTASAENPDNLSPNEHRQLRQLTDQNGGMINIKWDEKRGTPSHIQGKLSKPLKGEPLEMSLAFLNSVKELYHFDNAKKSFRLKRVDIDQLGMKHVRLIHVANDIPVWGDEIIVHIDKNNIVRSVNGEFTPKIETNAERFKKPQILPEVAIKNALKDVQVEKPDAPAQARLFYFPYPEPDSVTLTYVVNVSDQSKPADWKVFVDAITGDVVHKYNDIKFQKGQQPKQKE